MCDILSPIKITLVYAECDGAPMETTKLHCIQCKTNKEITPESVVFKTGFIHIQGSNVPLGVCSDHSDIPREKNDEAPPVST